MQRTIWPKRSEPRCKEPKCIELHHRGVNAACVTCRGHVHWHDNKVVTSTHDCCHLNGWVHPDCETKAKERIETLDPCVLCGTNRARKRIRTAVSGGFMIICFLISVAYLVSEFGIWRTLLGLLAGGTGMIVLFFGYHLYHMWGMDHVPFDDDRRTFDDDDDDE